MYKTSNSILKRALNVIPEQTMTFAKAAHNYPVNSPKYVKSAKGCWVTDVDGNKFIDFTMGLGTNVLGYNPDDVIQDVKEEMDNGILFSLPTEKEVILAEIFIDLIPSAKKVRFFKNGADVCSIALRLSQSENNKNMVAYCGYHGHHEWYSHTLRNSNVPDYVVNNLIALPLNDEIKTKKLFTDYGDRVTAVILEIGFEAPENSYLILLKELCIKNNVNLILDEMWTGFRFPHYTAQEYFKLVPDLSLFSKGMASGFPISCVVGREELMDQFQNIWGYTTFGSESMSMQAAISTIKLIQQSSVINYIWKKGQYFIDELNKSIATSKFKENIQIVGFPCRFKLDFMDDKLSNVFTKKLQIEFIENKILWNNMFVISGSHKTEDINHCVNVFDKFIKSNF